MPRKNHDGWACKTKGGNWVRFYDHKILFRALPLFVERGDPRWVKVKLVEVKDDPLAARATPARRRRN